MNQGEQISVLGEQILVDIYVVPGLQLVSNFSQASLPPGACHGFYPAGAKTGRVPNARGIAPLPLLAICVGVAAGWLLLCVATGAAAS